MKLFGYILFTALGFCLMYFTSMLFGHSEPHEAVEPDLYLSNSKLYAQEHAYSRSVEHLEKAIRAIHDIEQEIDPQSQKTVDKALRQLEIVKNEMEADSLSFKDMNEAFANALNALTYAEIKITEKYLESHDLDNAKVALKHGMLHIKNALKYSQGKKYEQEVHLYSKLDSIVNNPQLSHDEIIARLEHMLYELDTIITVE